MQMMMTSSVLLDIDTAVSEAPSQVATGQIALGLPLVQGDEVWENEERKVAHFVACGCSCNLGPKETLPQTLVGNTVPRESG